ncbi:MAG: LLM class flavin-dependent oxidoreductase [Actinomycetota bacterium]
MDRGRELAFGISLAPEAGAFEEYLELARLADELGLDFVGIQDHPYVSRFLDTWTLIAWLAAQTERVRFVPDVANLPLRGAAMLAKAAASLDVLTGGRIELGIGAGAVWDRIAGMGGPRRTPAEALASTDEAIDVIKAFWRAERPTTVAGDHYGLEGVHPGPPPHHPIEIWVGAYGPKMLALIGAKADGWLPSLGYAPPERLPAMQARIDDAAEAAGRDPGAIRRAYNVAGAIGETASAEGMVGSASMWTDTLARWTTDVGMDTYIFWPTAEPQRQIALFAEEIVPAVRKATGR